MFCCAGKEAQRQRNGKRNGKIFRKFFQHNMLCVCVALLRLFLQNIYIEVRAIARSSWQEEAAAGARSDRNRTGWFCEHSTQMFRPRARKSRLLDLYNSI